MKTGLAAVRKGRAPGLNGRSGCKPGSPHTTVTGTNPTEIHTNISFSIHFMLSALCLWLTVSLNNSTLKKQIWTNHSAILTVYSMVPWGFWETIFFSFFSLVLFWLSSKEGKKDYNCLLRHLCINMFQKRFTGCANCGCKWKQTHQKYLLINRHCKAGDSSSSAAQLVITQELWKNSVHDNVSMPSCSHAFPWLLHNSINGY